MCSKAIVNVASVPQRSPFRYPGGKTWLIPRVRQWLSSLPNKPRELIEPFAGGGSVGLTAAFENLVETVTLVELDGQVACVWETILGEHNQWLADRIANFELNAETVQRELQAERVTVYEQAFQTILRNRINRGGILAPGTGILKQGENGRGLTSRWYPETLRRRVVDIQAVRHKMQSVQRNGLDVMQENAHRPDVVFFIDPPYTAAGKKAGSRLYTHSEIDHEELFAVAETLTGSFLMTYDNADGVRDLTQKYGFAVQAIPMKNTHRAEMTELLIGRNLDFEHGA